MINKLIQSKWKGHFIEVGAGMPVSHKLMESPHTSEVMLSAYSPYSKREFQAIKGDNRAVSRETVYAMLCSRALDINEFVYASSCQIGQDKCNHGWLGIRYKDSDKTSKIYIIHVTIPDSNRIENIKEFGYIGMRLIGYKLLKNQIPRCSCIDIAPNNEEIDMGLHSPVIYSNKQERLEILRDYKNVAIFKGSFNPLHDGHKFIYNDLVDRGYEAVFMLSLYNEGKKELTKEEILRRVEKLKEAYPLCKVLLFSSGKFDTIKELLSNRLPNCNFTFAMGRDTYDRCPKGLFDNKEFNYLVYDRGEENNVTFVRTNEEVKNISSTKIREQNEENN